MWEQFHLKKVSEDFEDELTEVIEAIEEAEEERKGESLAELTDVQLVALIEDKTMFDGRDAELAAAFVRMFDLTENDFDDIEIDGNNCSVQGVDYLAGNDEEMDDEWDASLDNYLEECVYPDLPDTMRKYFDDERWKRDARIDGRAHSLNRYDGREEEVNINGTYYFAYRQ